MIRFQRLSCPRHSSIRLCQLPLPVKFGRPPIRAYAAMAKGRAEHEPPAEKAKDNTHIERTASQFRQSGFFLAEIESFRHRSPSVRLIQLKILPPTHEQIDGLPEQPCEEPHLFTFKPGQWIDTYVPHLPKPGGFSFVSTPKYFRDRGLTTLSIQLTENPPSKWLWRNDIVGQKLMIRVGGNFTLPPTGKSPDLSNIDYLQFVAGGVGINPLISMLQSLYEEAAVHHATKVVFHYIVRSQDQALFLDTIAEIGRHFGDRFEGRLWITRQTDRYGNTHADDRLFRIHRQIAPTKSEVGCPWEWWDTFLQRSIETFDTDENRARSLAYICGPRGLTDRLMDVYEEHGMSTKAGHVQVEKWW